MTRNEIIQAIDEIKQTEKKLKESKDQFKKSIKTIGANIIDIFKESDYATVKAIFDTIKYYLDDKALLKDIESIIETKKMEKYPELCKPTYYPEINTLNISDSEKLRLDKYARMNVGKYMSGNENSSYPYPLSVNDLELLKTIGIVEKFYTFNEIDDLNKFEAYMDSGQIQIMYKVIKNPNLKYESL